MMSNHGNPWDIWKSENYDADMIGQTHTSSINNKCKQTNLNFR